jgi:DNA-binding MarR family transcriptional regulator
MLNRAITAIYDEVLRPLDLRVSQLNILIVAAKLGIARPPEVCKRLQLEISTLSRNVERLYQRGWIEYLAEQDARTRPFRVTKAGLKLIEKAMPAWQEAQRHAESLLGKQGVAFLHNSAKHLTA